MKCISVSCGFTAHVTCTTSWEYVSDKFKIVTIFSNCNDVICLQFQFSHLIQYTGSNYQELCPVSKQYYDDARRRHMWHLNVN